MRAYRFGDPKPPGVQRLDYLRQKRQYERQQAANRAGGPAAVLAALQAAGLPVTSFEVVSREEAEASGLMPAQGPKRPTH